MLLLRCAGRNGRHCTARWEERHAAGASATTIGNTALSAIFGVAACAQPAMGRAFLAGKPNIPDFYNAVYGAPLFGAAAVGLLFFMAGGILAGSAVVGSGQLPGWAGWVYAIACIAFALSTFLMPVGQSVASARHRRRSAPVQLRRDGVSGACHSCCGGRLPNSARPCYYLAEAAPATAVDAY